MSVQDVLARLHRGCALIPDEPFVFPVDRDVVARPAAVLVPILDYGERATVLLTKRSAHLTAHAGQVSFPGGLWEEQDDSLLATALRECEEELAIPASRIRILGEGRERITGTGFRITPFIGHIPAPVAYHPDPSEVETAFELPLEMALQASVYERLHTDHDGARRVHDALHYEGHCIWGATAGILRDICRMFDGDHWEDPAC